MHLRVQRCEVPIQHWILIFHKFHDCFLSSRAVLIYMKISFHQFQQFIDYLGFYYTILTQVNVHLGYFDCK